MNDNDLWKMRDDINRLTDRVVYLERRLRELEPPTHGEVSQWVIGLVKKPDEAAPEPCVDLKEEA